MAWSKKKRFKVICPSPSDLSSVCNQVKCSEKDCNSVFHSTSNLNMHLIKHHKIESTVLNKRVVEYHYHCPEASCGYSVSSSKFFKKLKYLKQHYLKVHAERNVFCKKCKKEFATESLMNLHLRTCGMFFVCSCGWAYKTNEAILTHCRRKGHTIRYKIIPDAEVTDGNVTPAPISTTPVKKDRPIYPKLSVSYIAAVALIELSSTSTNLKAVDKEVQTDILDVDGGKIGKKYIVKNDRKRKNSQQTQTGGVGSKCKKLKISAETQTNSDYTKQLRNRHKNTARKRKKSMETQTHKQVKKEQLTHKKNEKNSSTRKSFTKTATYSSAKQLLDDKTDVKNLQKPNTSKCASSSVLNVAELYGSSSLATKRSDISSSEFKPKSSDISLLNSIEEDTMKSWCFEQGQNLSNKGLHRTSTQQPFITTLSSDTFNENQELNLFYDKESGNQKSELGHKDRTLFTDNCDTNLFDISKFSNIETQTELGTFLTECDEDTSFTLCSTTETQTTDDFDPLLYSHMYTQTCEEVDIFDFNFVDIETQTAWPDLDDCEYLSS